MRDHIPQGGVEGKERKKEKKVSQERKEREKLSLTISATAEKGRIISSGLGNGDARVVEELGGQWTFWRCEKVRACE